MGDTQRKIWDVCFVLITLISLIIVIPAGIVVSYRNHKDVKFELHWKEQDTKQKAKAVSNAIQEQTETFVYGQNNDPDNIDVNSEEQQQDINSDNADAMDTNVIDNEEKSKQDVVEENEEE